MTEADFAKLIVSLLRSDDDATCFVTRSSGQFEEVTKFLVGLAGQSEHDKGFSLTADGQPARVQAVRCFQGDAWSITVRRNNVAKRPGEDLDAQWLQESIPEENGFRPKRAHFYNGKLSLVSFAEVIDSLYGLLEPHAASPWKGFLYVTGATEVGKSNITLGLIFKYLDRLLQSAPQLKRRPHLVTYEDPIETLLVPIAQISDNRSFDYTPRQKNVDCKSLPDCTASALRQTPSILYCGELRDKLDLREAVRFGGTGHLAIATGHAGNLTEAASQLMTACEATSTGDRAIWWPKVLGIVHLKRVEVKLSGSLSTSAVVPAMYRRTDRGVQSFVSDGLASLLPYCPNPDDGSDHGSLGRQFVSRYMLKTKAKLRIHPLWKNTWSSLQNGPWSTVLQRGWGTFRRKQSDYKCADTLAMRSAKDDIDAF